MGNSGITQEKNIVNMNNENYDNGQSIRNVGTNSTLQSKESCQDVQNIDSTHLSKVSNVQALSTRASSDYNEYSFPTFNSGITQEKNIVNMNNENYDNGQSIRNVGTNSALQPTEISSHKSSYDDLLKQAL